MKKVIIIGLVFAGFGLTSCMKQQIAPVSQETGDVPVWEKVLNDDEEDDNTKPPTGDDGNEITDPNNDPDGNKK